MIKTLAELEREGFQLRTTGKPLKEILTIAPIFGSSKEFRIYQETELETDLKKGQSNLYYLFTRE